MKMKTAQDSLKWAQETSGFIYAENSRSEEERDTATFPMNLV